MKHIWWVVFIMIAAWAGYIDSYSDHAVKCRELGGTVYKTRCAVITYVDVK